MRSPIFVFCKGIKLLSLLLFLNLSLFANAQEFPLPVNPESRYCYLTSNNTYSAPTSKVQIYELSDEFCIKKKSDTAREKIEQSVNNVVPDAQISWIDADYCVVISESPTLGADLEKLMSDDEILSIRPAVIRQVYLDLMTLYPVKQVKLNCFDTQIGVTIKQEFMDEALALIESLGLTPWDRNPNNICQKAMDVAKELDIVSIANSLYESGFFRDACPSSHMVTRTFNNVEQKLDDFDYYYKSNGNKVYLYKSPGRFGIKKRADAEKKDIELLISDYLKSFSCKWVSDAFCMVDTDDELIDDIIEEVRKNNQVLSANRAYLIKGDYEFTLAQGMETPRDIFFDEIITLAFKEGVSQSTKDSLRNEYNLSFVYEREGQWSGWTASATTDVLAVCRNIYLSGCVRWVELNMINGLSIIYVSNSGTTTEIETHYSTLVKEDYYNLLGMPVTNPSGITIIVRKYDDGSIRTEKMLFP